MSGPDETNISELLRLGTRITVLPVIHGSGQLALTVRRYMLEHKFDCVAVPLPESFREGVEQGVLELPRPSIVLQPPSPRYTPPSPPSWSPSNAWSEQDDDDDDDELDDLDDSPTSYVPIDPCQPVIMAIRAAMGEHIPRAYIDLETDPFCPYSTVMPDPFAVRHVPLHRFVAALLPSITRPPDLQTRQRILHMASRLGELETRYSRVLAVVSVLYWPWIREAYMDLFDSSTRAERSEVAATPRPHTPALPEHDVVQTPVRYAIQPRSMTFFFSELPFIASLYERARNELVDDDDLQIDGVKELLLAARDLYRFEVGNRGRRVTPLLLSKCLQYIRNLSLIHRRMTPDLGTIVIAAKQVLGDQFALRAAELANKYLYADAEGAKLPAITLGIDQGRLPSGETVSLVSRLPGPPLVWRSLELQRRPNETDQKRWKYSWNPYGQCSYPPEDERIENFRTRVFDRAKAIVGNDLARTEKFTTSVKDGIDIRDTLRHWYEKQIYVKVVPPSRGNLDACVMLFDSPADPRDYPWRTTWFAEHHTESTLAFYATDFRQDMVGPGIGLAVYGGAMFLYPPVVIPDIWSDPRLDYTETLEERLIAAACLHSNSREIALLSSLPPGGGWRRLARRHRKHLVHVPMNSFSDEQVQQLRMVHVLNGSEVRSYAASFIRRV